MFPLLDYEVISHSIGPSALSFSVTLLFYPGYLEPRVFRKRR